MLELYVYFPEEWLSSYIRKGVEYLRGLIKQQEFTSLLENDFVYVEICELFQLYYTTIDSNIKNDLIEIQNRIHEVTGGYSLDYLVLNSHNDVNLGIR